MTARGDLGRKPPMRSPRRLIGSGNFYPDPQVGNGGKIGSLEKEFIEAARARLGLPRHA
jgi:hypothetical protein